MFEGKLKDEPESRVLVTLAGCKNTSLDIQIHGENIQDMMFSTEDGKLIATENEVYERVSRDTNDDYDDTYDDYVGFDFYDEFEDADNAEFDSEPLPSAPLILNVNVYLDIFFLKLHATYAERTARQVIKQASLILQHASLDTQIDLVPHVEIYKTFEHMEPNKKGITTFEGNLKPPYSVDDSPVTHVLLTANEKSRYKGIGRLGAVCSAIKKPITITMWNRNTPRTALTLAHEIGHVLGMHHDFNPVHGKRASCGEGRDKGTLIMNYGEPRTVWSKCSNQDFKRLYESVIYTKGKFCLKKSKTKGMQVTSFEKTC